MKKSFIFASFIALVAMLAVSCKPSVEKPKARFSYEVDGLTVKFTDASKDAVSYQWDFGDGSQVSAEQNPTHEYAEAGKYTVKLTVSNAGGEDSRSEEINVEPKLVDMKIDGKFDDWAQIPASLLAVAEADENSKYELLHKIMFYTDADNIFFYFEFDASTGRYFDEESQEEFDGFEVDYVDMYLNLDDDPLTGSNSYLWVESAAEYLIEGSIRSYTDAGMFFFASEDQTAWGWTDSGVSGIIDAISEPVKLENGALAVEGKIMRAMFPITPKAMKVGVFTSNSGWSETGCLPQTTIKDDGSTEPSPLLEVKLN